MNAVVTDGAAQVVPTGGGPIPGTTISVPTATQTVQIVGNYNAIDREGLNAPNGTGLAGAGIVTIQQTGVYSLSANICFSAITGAAADGDVRVVYIYRNTNFGTQALATVDSVPVSGDGTVGTPTCLNAAVNGVRLEAGDRVFVGVRQTSASGDDVTVVSGWCEL